MILTVLYMFYIWKGSTSESACELLTMAEQITKEARDLKIKVNCLNRW